VATARDRDTYAIARFDPKTRQFGEVLASHARYDMGAQARLAGFDGFLRKPVTGEIIGYRVEAERPQTSWTDESYARLQALVDRSLPGRVNTFQRSEGRTLITSYSDRVPPEYFLMDEAARKAFRARWREKMEGAVEQVVPGSTGEQVIATAGIEGVIAGTAMQGVIPLAS